MKCNDALALMMEADEDDLEATGPSSLAAHIAACRRCSAVALALRDDTKRLAGAFAGPHSVAAATSFRQRRTRWAVVVSPATALAATVLLWIMLKGASEPLTVPVPVPVSTAPSVATKPPAAAVVPEGPPSLPTPRLSRVATPTAVRPVAVQATAFVPVALAAVADDPEVRVDPPPGMRATIVRGRNNVTVVWLTK